MAPTADVHLELLKTVANVSSSAMGLMKRTEMVHANADRDTTESVECVQSVLPAPNGTLTPINVCLFNVLEAKCGMEAPVCAHQERNKINGEHAPKTVGNMKYYNQMVSVCAEMVIPKIIMEYVSRIVQLAIQWSMETVYLMEMDVDKDKNGLELTAFVKLTTKEYLPTDACRHVLAFHNETKILITVTA